MNTAAAPSPFTFDLDLGHREEKTRVLTEERLAALIEQARREGHAAGLAEGERGAAATASRNLAAAGEKLANRAAQMNAALAQTETSAKADAAELALTIARKLALNLIAREPQAELAALAAECMATLQGAPHMVIRCNDALADAMREAATARMAATGFAGKLVVIGDPDLALSDGRVEWADGGVERDLAAISAEIDKAIAGYFGRRDGKDNKETAP